MGSCLEVGGRDSGALYAEDVWCCLLGVTHLLCGSHVWMCWSFVAVHLCRLLCVSLFCLFASVSVRADLSLCMCLFVCLHTLSGSLSLSHCLFYLCLSQPPSLSLSCCLVLSLYVFLLCSLSLSLSLFLADCLSLSLCLPVCLSLCPSGALSSVSVSLASQSVSLPPSLNLALSLFQTSLLCLYLPLFCQK